MKTSKKLLSFFLAVVMVVTTCSVGFTAFAQDNKNSIWSTSSEAEDAFNTLNGLADEFLPGALMGIDLVANGVYEKYAKELGKSASTLTDEEKADIAAKATLKDILAVLQPTLLNALSGTSQQAYVDDVLKHNAYGDAKYYDYLLKYVTRYTTNEDGDRVLEYLTYEKDEDGNYKLDENGNRIEKYVANPDNSEKVLDESSMTFFTLYALCVEYKDNRDLSKDTRDTLEDWYNKLDEIANLQIKDDLADLMQKYKVSFEDEGYEFATSYLYEFEQFFTDEYVETEFTDEEKSLLASACEKYNTDLKAYNFDANIDSFAELAYYGFGAGRSEKYLHAYYELIKLAGGTFAVQGDYDLLDQGAEYPYNIPNAKLDTDADFDVLREEVLFQSAIAKYDLDPDNLVLNDKSITREDLITYLFSDLFGYEKEELDKGVVLSPDEYDYMVSYSKWAVIEKLIEFVMPNFKNDIITGLVITYSDEVNTANDLIDILNSRLPGADDDGNILTVDEIKEIASFIKTVGTTDFGYVGSLFKNGSYSGVDVLGGFEVNPVLPENIRNTYFSEYVSLMCTKNDDRRKPYVKDFYTAFFSEMDNNYNSYFLLDGTPVPTGNNATELIRYPESNLAVLNYNDGATYDLDTINVVVADSIDYAYARAAADLLGVDTLKLNDDTGVDGTVFDYKEFLDSQIAPTPAKVVLTDDQLDILYADYSLDNEIGTEILNYVLNNTIVSLLENDMVSGIITGVLGDVDLVAAIKDIWERLCDSPVGTVFELLPVLVVVVDQILLPVLFNAEGDAFNGKILPMLGIVDGLLGGILPALTIDEGSYIGINQIGWDLNTLLPNLMNWLFDGKMQRASLTTTAAQRT
ncbi:MAG: hypothetical protein K2L19_09635 [Eubacterium sp.]|nr:hypothetical protein [Eubacterium sp.]